MSPKNTIRRHKDQTKNGNKRLSWIFSSTIAFIVTAQSKFIGNPLIFVLQLSSYKMTKNKIDLKNALLVKFNIFNHWSICHSKAKLCSKKVKNTGKKLKKKQNVWKSTFVVKNIWQTNMTHVVFSRKRQVFQKLIIVNHQIKIMISSDFISPHPSFLT